MRVTFVWWLPWALGTTLWLGACRDDGAPVLYNERRPLQVEPGELDLEEVYVGTQRAGVVHLRNEGSVTLAVHVGVIPDESAFAVASGPQRLAPGEVASVAVHFLPTEAGAFTAELRVEDSVVTQRIPLRGTGTDTPDCDDGNVCTGEWFDVGLDACVVTDVANTCDDGSACTTDDACAAGECMGFPRPCEDDISCTVDSCDEAVGCVHTSVDALCTNDGDPCTVEHCVAGRGCATQWAANGTPCGSAQRCQQSVCWWGQCVVAPVPDGTRCEPSGPCALWRRCRAGECHGGVDEETCYGTVVSSGVATGILVDDQNVYVASTDRVVRFAKSSGSAKELAQGTAIHGLISDDVSLYWRDAATGEVRGVAKTGGEPWVVATASDPLWSAASDGSEVFWISDGILWRTPTRLGAPQAMTEAAGRVVGVDDQHVYWRDHGVILRIRKTETEQPRVVVSRGNLIDVKLHAGRLYWTWVDGTRSLLESAASDGTDQAILLRSQMWLADIVVDARRIHVLAGGRSEVLLVMDSAVGTLSVHTQDRPGLFGVDDESIYYFTAGDSLVRRASHQAAYPVLVAELPKMRPIHADRQRIVWVDGANRIGATLMGGGEYQVLVEAGEPRVAAADAFGLYWAQSVAGDAGATIMMADLDVSNPRSIAYVTEMPEALFATDLSLIWLTRHHNARGERDGKVHWLLRSDGTVTTTEGALDFRNARQDGDVVRWIGKTYGFWDVPDQDHILAASWLPGDVQHLVLESCDDISTFFAEGNVVYWTAWPFDSLRMQGLPGASIWNHAGLLHEAREIRTWGGVAFWTNDSGALWRTSLAAPQEVRRTGGGGGHLLAHPDGVAWIQDDPGLAILLDGDRPAPETFAVVRSQPSFLAADESGVYWIQTVDDGVASLIQYSPDREGPRVLVSDLFRPSSLAVHDGSVFLTDAGRGEVRRVNADGTSAILASGESHPRDILIDDDAVTWVADTIETAEECFWDLDAVLWSIPADTGEKVCLVYAGSMAEPQEFGQAWIWRQSDGLWKNWGPSCGGYVERRLPGPIERFAVDAEALYFVRESSLHRVERGDAEPRALTTSAISPLSQLLVDGNRLYWLDASGSILFIDKNGAGDSQPQVLATVQHATSWVHLVQVGDMLYWTEDGSIVGALKPPP
ncbi:MAG: hypothetical protein AB2A00_03260 [Myxococcota bacterium]